MSNTDTPTPSTGAPLGKPKAPEIPDTQTLLSQEYLAFLLHAGTALPLSFLASPYDPEWLASCQDSWRALPEDQKKELRGNAQVIHQVMRMQIPGHSFGPLKKLSTTLREIITIPAKLAYDLPGLQDEQ
jgi:hypothetical protein